MKIGLIGDSDSVDYLHSTLKKYNIVSLQLSPNNIFKNNPDNLSLLIAVDHIGSKLFNKLNTHIDFPWMAAEIGGIGGHSIPDAIGSVSLFYPGNGCYDCLRKRVKSNMDSDMSPPVQLPKFSISLISAIILNLIEIHISIQSTRSRVFEISNISPVKFPNKISPIIERILLPTPNCPSCIKKSINPFSGTDIERAEYSIDERIGIVKNISENESFPVPYYLANLCDTAIFTPSKTRVQSASVAIDWDAAFIKTVCEALERYSSRVHSPESFISGPASELQNCILPSLFVQPKSNSYAGESIYWMPGIELHSNTSVLLPAEFVIFPPHVETYKPAITTGLALGNSIESAQLSGIYEVIERDATMLSWYSTFSPTELLVDDPSFKILSRRARSEGLTSSALLITQDIEIPVVTAAVYRDSDWPKFAVGSCANIDPNIAAVGALSEALQNWMELRSMGIDSANKESSSIGAYSTFPKEVKSFITTQNSIMSSELSPPPFETPSEELSFILNKLRNLGLPTYSVTITPPDVSLLGFEAVRILIPDAQPLFFGNSFFGNRARTVPSKLGNYRPRFDRPHHPYP